MTQARNKRRNRAAVIAVLLCALLASLAVAVAPAAAEPGEAQTLPQYDGDLTFPPIEEASGPEEFSWQVRLGPEQVLRLVSETEAEVDLASGMRGMAITAIEAHDASGTQVPTALSVSAGDVLTLTVRHREGNPAAGGAPFHYPIFPGQGFEPRPPVIVVGPPDEAEIAAQRAREAAVAAAGVTVPPPAPSCTVPALHGLALHSAKARLRAADCAVGKVHLAVGTKTAGAKVVKQFRPPGADLAAGAPVPFKLG